MPARPSERLGSIVLGSSTRFAAEILGLALSFLTGVIVARDLGPDGKGVVATLGYLTVLFGNAAALGLGEAAVTLIGRGAATVREALSTSLTMLVASCLVGVTLFYAVALPLLRHTGATSTTIAITAATVPLLAVAALVTALVDSQRLFVVTSAVRALSTLVTAAATAVLVLQLHLALSGAMLAAFLGWAIVPALLSVVLARHGAAPWPGWDLAYARAALRLGAPIQVSWLMMIAGARLDVLVVLAIRGEVDAGLYSVAVTLGSLASFGPFALSVVSYPRLAGLPQEAFAEFAFRLVRTAFAAAVAGGALVALTVPWITPLAFGHGFEPAVEPALVLIVGAVLWSGQWTLSRAAAAVSRPRLLVTSFAVSVVVMLTLDLALVPPFGIVGAAVASDVSGAAGLMVALVAFRREFAPGEPLRSVLPTRAEFHELRTLPRQLRQLVRAG